MHDTILSMDEAKRKLMKLEDVIPDADELLGNFGRFLAGRLNPQLVPMGFVIVCEMALYDLQAGVDSLTMQPIQNRLVGHPPIVYGRLRREIPHIADAIFPFGFAAKVRLFIEEVKAKARAEQPPVK